MAKWSFVLAAPAVLAVVVTAVAPGCRFQDETVPVEGALQPPPDVTAPPDTTPTPDVVLPSQIIAVNAPASWEHDMMLVPYSTHLTWQRDPARSVTASWATITTPPADYTPRLWIVPKSEVDANGGEMPYADEWVIEGYGQLYNPVFLGQAALEDEEYSAWHAEITTLEPDTEYVYRVGTWEDFDKETGEFVNPTLSTPATFRTGLVKGDRRTFDVVLCGDSRGGYAEISAEIDRLAEIDARMWFFNGDANDAGTQVEWDAWFDVMQPLLRKKVLMPVQGNHELSFGNLYYVQFELPKMPLLPEEMSEHAWSVDYANVHFVGLDSNGPEIVQQQTNWLQADLAAASSDPDIDFIVVMMHHPAYSNSNHGSTTSVQNHFVPILEEFKVDLVFAGHDHNYERTVPMRNDTEDEDNGVTYVVAGAFFSKGYSNGSDWYTVTSHHGDKRNYVVMRVSPDRLDVTAFDGTGTETLDQFTILKRER